jgi:hypothetical protein
MNNSSEPAAYFCRGRTIGGYTDWYLPAKNELEVLYYFLKPSTTSNDVSSGSNANAVSPEPVSTTYTTVNPPRTSVAIFQSTGAQRMDSDDYWSSTQFGLTQGAYQQWNQLFLDGYQWRYPKDYELYVRAVRRVAV